MKYFHDNALDETGAQLSDTSVVLHSINLYNSHATDPIYLKFFFTDTAPTYASDTPDLALTFPVGVTTMVLDVGLPPCFIQASADVGAGNTAPAADPVVTMVYMKA
jgi:hypothetical protein